MYRLDISEDSVEHTLRLIKPRLEEQLQLRQKVTLIETLKV